MSKNVPIVAPKKIVALSDIHGRYDALLSLSLERYIADGYRVVFMGDYVGYGDKSAETLAYVVSLKKTYPDQVSLLLGNWEDMLHVALFHENKQERGSVIQVFFKKGWRDGFKQFRDNEDLRKLVEDFPRIMDVAYFNGSYCFAHAGVNPALLGSSMPLRKIILGSNLDHLVWNLDFIDAAAGMNGPYRFVVGHRPVQTLSDDSTIKPYVSGCVVGIDMGASRKKGCLGLIKFDENGQRSFLSVPSCYHRG